MARSIDISTHKHQLRLFDGKNVSHGCIRMHNHDVIELSSVVPIRTHVSIHK